MSFKGEKCFGGKRSKERITIALCTNFDGTDKRKPIVIGKSLNPRWMKHMKQPLPVHYRANKSAWMTTVLFEEWLVDWNRELSIKNRKIILIVDNCTAHTSPKLSHISLHFLPPNCTSKLQPLDLGIIKNFKVHYRHSLLTEILADLEKGRKIKTFTVGESITMVVNAWRQVTTVTITNCWLKALPSLTQHKDFQSDTSEVQICENADSWSLVDCEMEMTWDIVIGKMSDQPIGVNQPSLDDFINVDDDTSVCDQFVIQKEKTAEIADIDLVVESDTAVQDESDEEEELPSLVDVLDYTRKIEKFLVYQGLTDNLKHVDVIRLELSKLLSKKKRQTTVTEFFKPSL
jgi:hypothetical protein